jgi:hypothetical protein
MESKPKRPTNAYFKFRKEFLEEDGKKNPTADFKDRTTRFNEAWKELDKTDPKKKERFETLFHKEMEVWTIDNEQWKKDHPEEADEKKPRKEKKGKS